MRPYSSVNIHARCLILLDTVRIVDKEEARTAVVVLAVLNPNCLTILQHSAVFGCPVGNASGEFCKWTLMTPTAGIRSASPTVDPGPQSPQRSLDQPTEQHHRMRPYSSVNIHARCLILLDTVRIVDKEEARTAVVVLAVLNPNCLTILQHSAVFGCPVGNASGEFCKMDRCIGVVSHSKEEYLAVQLVHPAHRALGGVRRVRRRRAAEATVGLAPACWASDRIRPLPCACHRNSGHAPRRGQYCWSNLCSIQANRVLHDADDDR